jgi:hypothetical protein
VILICQIKSIQFVNIVHVSHTDNYYFHVTFVKQVKVVYFKSVGAPPCD